MTTDKFQETDDKFLADLMRRMPQEKLPSSFTSGVMMQLQANTEPLADSSEYRRQMIWAYLSLLLAAGVVIFMLVAGWPFIKINIFSDTYQLRNLLNASLGILEGFNTFINYLRESSTIIIICITVGFLLLAERLLRSRMLQNRSFTL